MIAQSLEANRDLRVAVLAIERARAQYGVSRADLFPTVGATGAGTRSRTADDLTAAGRASTASQYSAQIGFASYEIDFFGRVRNLNDAALQEFLRVGENGAQRAPEPGGRRGRRLARARRRRAPPAAGARNATHPVAVARPGAAQL